MKRLLGPLVLSAALLAAAPAASGITLEPLGRTAAQGEGGAEIAAFHAGTERAFVTNAAGGTLDIYDFSDPSAPVLLESVALPGGPNSVDVSERWAGGRGRRGRSRHRPGHGRVLQHGRRRARLAARRRASRHADLRVRRPLPAGGQRGRGRRRADRRSERQA